MARPANEQKKADKEAARAAVEAHMGVLAEAKAGVAQLEADMSADVAKLVALSGKGPYRMGGGLFFFNKDRHGVYHAAELVEK